jgi:hypothetical protein
MTLKPQELLKPRGTFAVKDIFDRAMDADQNDEPVPQDIQHVMLTMWNLFVKALVVLGFAIGVSLFEGEGLAIGIAWTALKTATLSWWAGKIGVAALWLTFKTSVVAIASAIGAGLLIGAALAGAAYLVYRYFRWRFGFGKKKRKKWVNSSPRK